MVELASFQIGCEQGKQAVFSTLLASSALTYVAATVRKKIHIKTTLQILYNMQTDKKNGLWVQDIFSLRKKTKKKTKKKNNPKLF